MFPSRSYPGLQQTDSVGLLLIFKRTGTPIPTNDIWIAVQAMGLDSELISFDEHFERVPKLLVVHPAK
jgi:predicted nucleic acid-binding protein